jgi:hypothetical protein
MSRNQYIMLPMTKENIIRYLSAAVLGVVIGLVILMAGFPARPVTFIPPAGHAFAYHSLAAGHENV